MNKAMTDQEYTSILRRILAKKPLGLQHRYAPTRNLLSPGDLFLCKVKNYSNLVDKSAGSTATDRLRIMVDLDFDNGIPYIDWMRFYGNLVKIDKPSDHSIGHLVHVLPVPKKIKQEHYLSQT